MPNVADYVVLADGKSSLQIGGDIDQSYSFNLPSTAIRTGSAILTLRMEAEASPSNLNWEFKINGTQVMSFTHGKDRFCAIQEVFGAGILKSGANTAEARVNSGSGRIEVSDIVVWFQNAV